MSGDYLVIGKLGAAHGIRGWLKLHSYTEPPENILSYRSLAIDSDQGLQQIEILESQKQGNGFIARIKACDDRDATRFYTGRELFLKKEALPALEQNEYYWHQLEGLRVISTGGDDLGVVDHLLATGANDVLVVRPDAQSIDQEERLIPYVREKFVRKVDLTQQEIVVDWDKDY